MANVSSAVLDERRSASGSHVCAVALSETNIGAAPASLDHGFSVRERCQGSSWPLVGAGRALTADSKETTRARSVFMSSFTFSSLPLSFRNLC